ncbi:MAG: hypothetical protein AAB972_04765 [Patescibacteria group bacterium]
MSNLFGDTANCNPLTLLSLRGVAGVAIYTLEVEIAASQYASRNDTIGEV